MVAARWRTRRMWTIETGLLNAEILTQQSNPTASAADQAVHLASAYRALSNDSRSLALASRYEARHQGIYDRAYKRTHRCRKLFAYSGKIGEGKSQMGSRA